MNRTLWWFCDLGDVCTTAMWAEEKREIERRNLLDALEFQKVFEEVKE